MKPHAFAEIMESSLSRWKARSWQWDYAPAFGSLVTLEQKGGTLYGIIHHVEMGSSDATRQPFIYQKTEEELRAEQPQIFEFLMTTFLIAPLGFKEDTTVHYQLPPTPPKIHSFVSHATGNEQKDFFKDTAFLHTLFSVANSINHLDELLLAILKNSMQYENSSDQCARFLATYSQLAHNDYTRIRLFCQRAQRLIGSSHVYEL